MRRHNLALVLGEIADGEPVSRAAVAATTGLTRGTVSSLVDELLAAGLVTELAARRGGTGRPASPLQLNRAGPGGLGIEIGIDHVGVCLVDLAGQPRTLRTIPSDHRDEPPQVGLRAAADLAARLVTEAGLTIGGAVVAVPGIVDPVGVLHRAPNLPRWTDVPVGALLGPLLTGPLEGVGVRVGNEADLAALGERWAGDAPADMIYVSGEIGVGGAVVLRGELFGGGAGRAGEIGHVVVDPAGPPCRCGSRGCLERVAGLEALLAVAGARDLDDLLLREAAHDLAASGIPSAPVVQNHGDQRSRTPSVSRVPRRRDARGHNGVRARADRLRGPANEMPGPHEGLLEQGDDGGRRPDGQTVVAVAGRALGVALAGAVNLLDVPAVVLGGVYAQLGEPLRVAVAAELAARVAWRDPPEVRTAMLGREAALRGAATSVVRDILRRPVRSQ